MRAVPTQEQPVGTPPRRGLTGEWRTVLEPLRLLRAAPRLARAPRGQRRVVTVPGYGATDASMAPLRAFLRTRGHDVRGWGLGRNGGDPEADRLRLAGLLRDLVAEQPGTIDLVAWSLGGVIARETARVCPALVGQIITYGSPIIGGPTHTVAASNYGEEECARIAALQRTSELENPLQVPVTAIYTRRDRVVDWRSCIDRHSRDVVHQEVQSTHVGMGVDPDVWEHIAAALAVSGSRLGAQ